MKKWQWTTAALMLGGLPALAEAEASGGILDGISKVNDVVNGIVWGAPALILLAFVSSGLLAQFLPQLSEGTRVIVLTLVLCALAAHFFPRKEEGR